MIIKWLGSKAKLFFFRKKNQSILLTSIIKWLHSENNLWKIIMEINL